MISIRTIRTILLLAFVLVLALPATAQMQSDNYRITNSVLSGGGTTMDSATYQLTGTLGQSSCIGLSSTRDYIAYAGFWQPDVLEIKRRSLPWIPLLLLED